MGDRFSHSIDIGKALEEEAERLKKIEEEKKQAEEPQKEETSEEKTEPDTALTEDETEEPSSPPDPLEEEVQEIINKDIPVLRPKKTIWDQINSLHVLLFLLIIVLSGFWSLTLNDDLPLIDVRAEQAVDKQLQVGIASKINAEWEFLSQQEKARRATRMYTEARKTPEVAAEKGNLTQRLKRYYLSPTGIPYFFGIAPYKLSRLSQNIIEHGHPGEILKNDVAWDTLNLAPDGSVVKNTALPKFYANIYKVSRQFSSANLERTLFIAPVILGILSSIILFFIVRMLFGSLPALAASIVFAIHPLLLRASGSGHPGAQPVVLVLFLIVVLFAALIMKAKGFWRILSIIMVIPFSWWAVKIWESTLMPDSSFTLIIRALGGLFLVIFALISALVLGWKTYKNKEGVNIFMSIWLLISLAIMIWKPQLMIIALPAFCAIVGWGADGVSKALQNVFDWFVETPGHIVVRSIASVVVILFVIGTFWSAVKAESRVLPVMHDSIINTGGQIALKSDDSAIINTGWDLGALWQYAAERATVLDQETIEASRLWKLANAFVSTDESKAVENLRELNCKEECPEAFIVVTEDMLLSLPRYEAIAFQEVADISPDYDPNRISSVHSCARRGAKLTCGNDYEINLTSLDARRNTKNPSALHLYIDGTRRIRAFDDSNFDFVLVVFQDTDNDFRSFLVQNELADSMMVRLFVNDQNMRYFAPFLVLDAPDRVVTHSVLWEARSLEFRNVASADTSEEELGNVLASTLKD